jgi:GNAT superfamily N-acetyltransferase
MSERIEPSSPTDLFVRPYTDDDYLACRALWVELTEHHRRLYADPTIGGDDPGAALDHYLTNPDRAGSWVAVHDGVVVGLTGLFDYGTSGEVEPVVVTEAMRLAGVGRTLIGHVIVEARRRGYEYLAIRPVARNLDAIRAFYAVGFQTLGGHVDLTLDLRPRRHRWHDPINLHGLDFRY